VSREDKILGKYCETGPTTTSEQISSDAAAKKAKKFLSDSPAIPKRLDKPDEMDRKNVM